MIYSGRSYLMALQQLINWISANKKAFARKGLNFAFSINALSRQTCLSRGSRISKTRGSRQRRNRFYNRCRSDSISDILVYIKSNGEELGKSCYVDVPAFFLLHRELPSQRALLVPALRLGRKAALDWSVLNLLVWALFQSARFVVQEKCIHQTKSLGKGISAFLFSQWKRNLFTATVQNILYACQLIELLSHLSIIQGDKNGREIQCSTNCM